MQEPDRQMGEARGPKRCEGYGRSHFRLNAYLPTAKRSTSFCPQTLNPATRHATSGRSSKFGSECLGWYGEWMDDAGLGSPHSGRFATTRWTMVQAVGVDAPESKDALAELCSTYWYPLYAYLRRKGHQAVDAQDLTQAFVASLLERSAVKQADPEKGRFRSFLLGSLNKFVSDEKRRHV